MDNIGKIGVTNTQNWAKTARVVEKKTESAAQEVKDSFVASGGKAESMEQVSVKSDPISTAKGLIKDAITHLDAAKPDLANAEKKAADAEGITGEMDPHIKAINLDFIGRDVSAQGTIMREIGGKFDKKAGEGDTSIKEAKADMKPVKDKVEQALKELDKAGSKTSISSAKWQLENSLNWIDSANRDISMSGGGFDKGKTNIGEMKPYLDIVEMDTVETDVGRFSRDLKELKEDTVSQMIDAKLGAEFGNKGIDTIKEYLNKALKYLD